MFELPHDLDQEINELCSDGDQLLKQAKYSQALKKYSQAWALVPDPTHEWERGVWLLAAIGDTCFFSSDYSSALGAFRYATLCPGGIENPFINLRMGQCELELGEMAQATEHLLAAYMLEGKEIFARESDKYFEYLKTQILPPASGEW